MMGTGEHKLASKPHRQPSNELTVNIHAPSMHIGADLVAADMWQLLVDASQEDGRERGLVIATGGNAIKRSRVIIGSAERPSDEDPSKVIAASFQVPMLPFGLRSLLMMPREQVIVHTHPMSSALDHLQTSPITDDDIDCFVRSNYAAMIALDRGGAHLLARRLSFMPDNVGRRLQETMVDDITLRVIEEGGGTMDVMTRVAKELGRHGRLGYFYTPSLQHSGEGVKFKNLLFEQGSLA